MGSGLHAIEVTLLQIHACVIRHPAIARGSISMPDDPAHQREMAELGDLRDRLALLVQGLSNSLHLIALHEQIARRRPRGQRFSALQSVRDRRAAVTRIYERAVNTLEMLDEAGTRPPIADIMADLLKSTVKTDKDIAAIIQKDQGHHANLFNKDMQTVQNVPTLFILALVVAYLARLRVGKGGNAA